MITSFTEEYRFLSNFWPSPIISWGYLWPTVEHAFQAAKTNDLTAAMRIREASTPGQAKRLGRQVSMRPGWDGLKRDVMHDLVELKFALPELAIQLQVTGDQELVEGNHWHDNIWGNCVCDRCVNIVGQNWLGQILMQVRKDRS